MVDDDRPGGGADDAGLLGRYFGPYDQAGDDFLRAQGPPDAAHAGTTHSEAVDDPYARPSFEAPEPTRVDQVRFPAPPGVPDLQPRSVQTPAADALTWPPPASESRRPGAGATVALAALVAIVVGAGAGFGGSLLAARQVLPSSAPPAASSAAPTPNTTDSPAPEVSRTPVPPAPNTIDTVEVARVALPSTVMIRVGSADDGVIGSGFVIDASGLIMTNSHVVAKAEDGAPITVVYAGGGRARASLVGRSASYDLAVIKVRRSKAVRPIALGDSDAAQVGQRVVAIGAPLGLQGTVTEGIVSAVRRPVSVGDSDTNAFINGIQTDAPINPGNSGGPLLDSAARVIGINSAILTLSSNRREAGNIGIGFAIPINQAMEIGELLIKNGRATYPVIGATVQNSADNVGVKVTKISSGGPADRAKLRVGDLVLEVAGRPVNSVDELVVTVREHRPNDVVEVTYRRNGDERVAKVKLDGKEG